MGSSAAAALSASSCSTNMRTHFFFDKNNPLFYKKKQNHHHLIIRASSSSDEDCNVEECAPDKEVGKVSMEWLAGEKTKVSGTFPPRRRDWSGYVEKDTAGQTNIYSVEPAVYVAESAISSGSSGMSADGSENTAALFGFGALFAVAAAAVVLLQVGKNPPPVQTLDYSGPSLSYYITKFKPSSPEIVQLSVPGTTLPDEPSAVPTVAEPSAVTVPEPSIVPETSSETTVDSGASETETTLAQQTENGVVTPQEPQVEVGSG